LQKVDKTPLIKPNIEPNIIPINNAIKTGIPLTIAIATIVDTNANIDPIDKSKFLPIIKKVIPIDIIPMVDICLPRLSKLVIVANFGWRIENMIKRSTIAIKIPNSLVLNKLTFFKKLLQLLILLVILTPFIILRTNGCIKLIS